MVHFDEAVVFDTANFSNASSDFGTEYSDNELIALKEMVDIIKNDEDRATLACWGDHSEYAKGY
nr:hypothetical protein [uncultured Campylobacter sp.]